MSQTSPEVTERTSKTNYRVARALAWVAIVAVFSIEISALSASYLLRKNHQDRVVAAAVERFPDGRTVFSSEDSLVLKRLREAYGLEDGPSSLKRDPRLSEAFVLRINPFPPFLAEWNPESGSMYGAQSFGWQGEAEYFETHELCGETDTTSSILVPKFSDRMMGSGDYFVCYVLVLSVKSEKASDPSGYKLIFADWWSLEGGSYNGREEIGFILLVSSVLFVILLLGTRRWGWARR